MNEITENNFDEKYMKIALAEAQKAYDNNEVPIGCIIVYNDMVIGKGSNMRITDKNVLSHAEIIAINEACGFMKDWRLEDCTLYVTVEPCPMCAGAIVQARIKRVVFGAENPKAGCAGSIVNLLQNDSFNHQTEVEKGVCADECAFLMKSFFKRFRNKGK